MSYERRLWTSNNKRNQRSEAKRAEKRSMKATKMVIGLEKAICN